MSTGTDNSEFDSLAEETTAVGIKPVAWVSPLKPLNLALGIKRKRQMAFLSIYAKIGRISQSCKEAKINPSTELSWRTDPWYAARFTEAINMYHDAVEAEVHARAIDGVEVPIIGRVQRRIGTDVDGNPIFGPEDAVIATKRVKSDLLLMFHAKRHMPEYRERYEAPHEERREASPMARITLRVDMIAEKNSQLAGRAQIQIESGVPQTESGYPQEYPQLPDDQDTSDTGHPDTIDVFPEIPQEIPAEGGKE